MKKIFILLMCSVSFGATAQFRLYTAAIAGGYQMSDMKALQKELVKQFNDEGVPIGIVLSYPSSLQAELGGELRNEDEGATLGGYIGYAVTQGRLHYKDYSGETLSTQKLKRFTLSFKGLKFLGANFHLYGKAGITATLMDLVFETTLSGAKPNKEVIKFNALGGLFEPGIQWEYPVKRFSFFIHAGYEINFNAKTHSSENDEAYLTNAADEPILVNWSGMRIGLGAAFYFNKNEGTRNREPANRIYLY